MSNAKEGPNLKNCKKTFNKYFNIDNALNAISSKFSRLFFCSSIFFYIFFDLLKAWKRFRVDTPTA